MVPKGLYLNAAKSLWVILSQYLNDNGLFSKLLILNRKLTQMKLAAQVIYSGFGIRSLVCLFHFLLSRHDYVTEERK